MQLLRAQLLQVLPAPGAFLTVAQLLLLLYFLRCSRSSVLDGSRRQKVTDALAKNVFLVDPRQVSSAAAVDHVCVHLVAAAAHCVTVFLADPKQVSSNAAVDHV
jgi:hypothetical protein